MRQLAEGEILRIENLQTSYMSRSGDLRVVDELDLGVRRSELLGIAGESGSGKTTLVVSVLRLIQAPGQIRGGHVWFRPDPDGEVIDLLAIGDRQLRQLRWSAFSYIPQGSMNALSPVSTVHQQMIDTMLEHGIGRGEANRRIDEALQMVNLPSDTTKRYPHELSGGMRQRVIIAGAITMRPPLILADEPTTALDVRVQRQILQSLVSIQRKLGTTIVLVSHDMAALSQVVDRLAIMYAGQVVESSGHIEQLFAGALHPYSQMLISSIPALGGERHRIEGIPGIAPSPRAWPAGCRFHPRCSRAMPVCFDTPPPATVYADGRIVSCHLYSSTEASGGTDDRSQSSQLMR